jgi:hypothetical protein
MPAMLLLLRGLQQGDKHNCRGNGVCAEVQDLTKQVLRTLTRCAPQSTLHGEACAQLHQPLPCPTHTKHAATHRLPAAARAQLPC